MGWHMGSSMQRLGDTQSLNLSDWTSVRPGKLFVNKELLNTRSPWKARSSVEQVFFEHRLRTSEGSESLNFAHRGASLGDLTFNLIAYGAEVEVTVNQLNRSHYVVVLPLSGSARVRNHDSVADLGRGSLVVLDPASKFRFEMSSDHNHLAIGIPKKTLARFCTEHPSFGVIDEIDFATEPYHQSEIGLSFFNFLAYICRELDSPDSFAAHELVTASIQHTFLSIFVDSLIRGKSTDQKHVTFGQKLPKCVQLAEAYIEQNLTENMNANDIALAAGVPQRTLYQAFCTHRGVSPSSWLKSRRLRRARRDLLDPNQADVTVTEISNRYQQYHVGRFSRAYFEEFGELPSRTPRA